MPKRTWVFSIVLFAGVVIAARAFNPPAAEAPEEGEPETANMAFLVGMFARSLTSVHAQDSGAGNDLACGKLESDALAQAKAPSYTNAALREFDTAFRKLHAEYAGVTQSAFCLFQRDFKAALHQGAFPATAVQIYHGQPAHFTIDEAPAGWARDLRYDRKGIISDGGGNRVVLYWEAAQGGARGFYIDQAHGYLQWDRASPDEFVRYLGNGYGELSYDRISRAVTLYGLKLDAASPGCPRLYARGTRGDGLLVARSAEATAAVETDALGASGLEGFWFEDSAATPAGEGALTEFQFDNLVVPELQDAPFPKSCRAVSPRAAAVDWDARPDGLF